MGYYRSYLWAYRAAAILGGGALLCGVWFGGLSLAGLLPLFLCYAVLLLAVGVVANNKGLRRFVGAQTRMLQGCDPRGFLAETEGCLRAANRDTRNTVLIARAQAFLYLGDFAAASSLLQQVRPDQARAGRNRQNDRMAYSVRCADLALRCGQLQAAAEHLQVLEREIAALPFQSPLRGHYIFVAHYLSFQLAVRSGRAGGCVSFFRRQLQFDLLPLARAQDLYDLGAALLLEGGGEAEAAACFAQCAAIAPQLPLCRQAAQRAAALQPQGEKDAPEGGR